IQGCEVAGELRLRQPLQLQLDRSDRLEGLLRLGSRRGAARECDGGRGGHRGREQETAPCAVSHGVPFCDGWCRVVRPGQTRTRLATTSSSSAVTRKKRRPTPMPAATMAQASEAL